MFTRMPEPGRVKTRLIAALGAAGAAAVHRRLLDHTLAAAQEASRRRPCAVQVWAAGCCGRSPSPLPWAGLPWWPQEGRGLGERMARACAHAFARGARRVVLVGTDCPALDAACLERAFMILEDHDLVLGPAHDGGYYLIGQTRSNAFLFRALPWGEAGVLAATLERAAAARLRVGLLDPLHDIDTADDLCHLDHHTGPQRG